MQLPLILHVYGYRKRNDNYILYFNGPWSYNHFHSHIPDTNWSNFDKNQLSNWLANQPLIRTNCRILSKLLPIFCRNNCLRSNIAFRILCVSLFHLIFLQDKWNLTHVIYALTSNVKFVMSQIVWIGYVSDYKIT